MNKLRRASKVIGRLLLGLALVGTMWAAAERHVRAEDHTDGDGSFCSKDTENCYCCKAKIICPLRHGTWCQGLFLDDENHHITDQPCDSQVPPGL